MIFFIALSLFKRLCISLFLGYPDTLYSLLSFSSLVNLTSKNASLGGKLKGNVNSDNIKIQKTADIEGVLNQKTLAIEEGAVLKIKTETYK